MNYITVLLKDFNLGNDNDFFFLMTGEPRECSSGGGATSR